MQKVAWSTKTKGDALQYDFEFPPLSSVDALDGWASILWIGDAHMDHPSCSRETLTRHLDLALARNIPVLIGGDFLCAMQGPNDRRRTYKGIRPEDQEEDYYSAITESAAKYLQPYREIITYIGKGNHETSVTRHAGVDMTKLLVGYLTEGGKGPKLGGYQDWFIVRGSINGHRHGRKTMYRHHGSGGGGPVTRGVIQTNRRAVHYQADVLLYEHIHHAWTMPIRQQRVTEGGHVVNVEQLHVCNPGLKDEYTGKRGGFAIEREHHPKPTGSTLLQFRCCTPHGLEAQAQLIR